jgi:hypothetical protein
MTENNCDYVNISTTKPGETVNVCVDLIAPVHSGKFSSEWVLSVNGFTFGPRIWCSIEVVYENSDGNINLYFC